MFDILNDKSVLITGGTGTFGKAFIDRALREAKPRRLIVFSRDEFKQDNLKKDLITKYPSKMHILRFFIGDVRDEARLRRAFTDVDYVIHAAAMKQVPACEYNPIEAIKTNINGAENIINAALNSGVKKVVALSTDKAVNPVNLYGGTKLVSDKLFISANAYSGKAETKFSVVRYGNVAGSRGSVIPFYKDLFNKGIKDLPVTHPDMSRFWITIEEAVELVVIALQHSNGGETFISKIPSFNILELVKAVNESGVYSNIGIREGEKLHEIMISIDDSRYTYEYEKHFIIYPNFEWWNAEDKLIPGGKKVQDGFEYKSNTNTEWLSHKEIKNKIRDME